jgi:hypothetical protein
MKRSELKLFLEDAKKAGYTVVSLSGGNSGYMVYKLRRLNQHASEKFGLWLTWGYRGLSAVRTDTDLAVCTSIRKTADMRKFLGLEDDQ